MLARIFELDRTPLWSDYIQRSIHRPWHEVDESSSDHITSPALDLIESADSYQVFIDVPGISRDEIEIELDGRRLMIKAQRSIGDLSGSKSLVSERRAFQYARTIILPNTVDQDAIEAGVDHGVLRLCLPKTDEATPRKIEVN